MSFQGPPISSSLWYLLLLIASKSRSSPKLPISTIQMVSLFKILLASRPTESLAEPTLHSYFFQSVRFMFVPDVTDVTESIRPMGMNRSRQQTSLVYPNTCSQFLWQNSQEEKTGKCRGFYLQCTADSLLPNECLYSDTNRFNKRVRVQAELLLGNTRHSPTKCFYNLLSLSWGCQRHNV